MTDVPRHQELESLLDLVLDGLHTEADARRLNEILRTDEDACRRYIGYVQLHGRLLWGEGREKVTSEEGAEGAEKVASGQWLVVSDPAPKSQNPEISKSPISNPQSLIPNPLPTIVLDDSPYPSPLASLPFYISHPFVFSNLFALLVIGLGALGAWFYQIDIPQQVVQTDRPNVSSGNISEAEKFEIVGRVTGMVDVKWADINTSTERNNNVPLGRKYALSSGLMEITYDTGAKVILQGPCTYKVDSRAGGYLAVGKLTARVEKKQSAISDQQSEKVASGQWSVASEERSGVRGQGAGKVASGQWSVAGETNPKSQITKSQISNPQSLIPNPSFSPAPVFVVRTPTATVTDLGTEFGVEVKPDKTTTVQVIRGVVEATRDARTGGVSVRERLVAGEAIRFSPTLSAPPQRLAGSSLKMVLAPDIRAALREANEAREAQQLLRPTGLVASAYHCVWDIDGQLLAENDREKAFLVATDSFFGRGEKNEGPRSSFDTFAQGLGIRDWGLEEAGGKNRKTAKSQIPNQQISNPQSLIPSPSTFVGLRYGQLVRMDRIKVFLGRQMGDGGNWAAMPRVFILKNPVDTDRTPPEQDTANWIELPMRPLFGTQFTPAPDKNPGEVIEIPLTGFSVEERTGYGWALGGVPGDGQAGYISITELRAYTTLPKDKNAEKGGTSR